MQKTLYIHIGHYKTGTTALQVFCSRHQAMLAEKHGLDYPSVRIHNAKHSGYAFALYKAAGVETLMHGFADPTPPEPVWAELFDHVRASPHPKTIISSEELMRVGQFPKAAERLKAIIADTAQGIDIRIIVYLRAPQSHLKSWHNQLVKMGQPVADFNNALEGAIEAIHYDYAQALAPWSQIFGAKNIDIRRYPETYERPGDLVLDFMAALGVKLGPQVPLPEGDPNPRLDDRLMEALRLMQNLGLPKHMIQTVREQATEYMTAQDKLGAARMPAGVARARTRAAQGLGRLAELGQLGFDPGDLARNLPEAEPPETVAQNLMMGYVLSETLALRRRFNRSGVSDLAQRLDAIEAHLGLSAAKPKTETSEPS